MKRKNSILYAITLLLAGACTDLEVEVKDSTLIEDEGGDFSGVDPVSALASSYTDLRQFSNQENLFALMEVTSDELLVPTRGTDWGDNGIWRTLHQHSWTNTHLYVLRSWNILNSNVFRTNQIIAEETGANATQLAEARFLRAFNMYFILDMFRQVPFRDVNEGVDVDPTVYTAQQAFDFIEADLMAALEGLPSSGPGAETNKASQAAANFMLAKLYLNKHIYLGGEPQAEDMTRVIEYVNAIEEDGFKLHSGYFEIFEPGVDDETILWTDGEVGNRIWNGLHYNQQTPDNTGGGWNGFSTTSEFYSLFEGSEESNTPGSGQEERRGYVPTNAPALFGIGYGFLVGQQYGPNGNELTDRAGRPLIFTQELPGLVGNNERTGIRIIKYHPSNGGFTRHYILLRYADAHLMRVEAILRGGASGEDALTLYNELRTIREASPAANITLDDILDERGRELYIEGWRRNDQIRFGTFTSSWLFKDESEEFRNVFPIPQVALNTNPNLVPTEGY